MKIVSIYNLFLLVFLISCSSTKTYENEIFPNERQPWLPVNPENFNKTEAQRIWLGKLGE